MDGCERHTVSGSVEPVEPGRLRRRQVQSLLQSKADEVRDYYCVKLNSILATARHFDVGVSCLRRFLKQQNWPTRCKSEAREIRQRTSDMTRRDTIAKVVHMRREGAILDDIARECGITVSSAFRILKRHHR